MRIIYILMVTWTITLSTVLLADDLPAGVAIGDGLDKQSEKNLSGAFFDGKYLWLVTNGNSTIPTSYLWKAIVNATGIMSKTMWNVGENGYEGITKIVTEPGDAKDSNLILLDEKKRSIVELTFDMNGVPKKTDNKWILPKYMKENWRGLGSEGITWIPGGAYDENKLLRTNKSGVICSEANCDEKPSDIVDGLALVAHQKGGYVYAFWLSGNAGTSDAILYGKYKTAKSESAGLEWDSESSELYIWHGGKHNMLEIVKLNSDPEYKKQSKVKLETVQLRPYIGAKLNLEGVGWDAASDELFLTADGVRQPNNLIKIKFQ